MKTQRREDLRVARHQPGQVRRDQERRTLASKFGKATEYYNSVDVNLVAQLPRVANLSGGWNVGNSISTLTTFPGATTSKSNQCFVVNSPQDLKYTVASNIASGCETGNRISTG